VRQLPFIAIAPGEVWDSRAPTGALVVAETPRVKMSWYQRSSKLCVRGGREKMEPLGDPD
jgi:hypothetical protein